MAQFATIFLVLAALAGPSLTAEVPINDGKYLLDYRVIIPSTLVIKITAETTGWVGWGISPDGAMIGGDMVMGGWDSSKGAYIGVNKDNFLNLARLSSSLVLLSSKFKFVFRIVIPLPQDLQD